ncbi:response regulator [Sphaerotilus natans]|uniref:response regulator n=1 Tax=Sphaerotilus natans TaxID=34103 RepID=UPI00406D46AA
MPLPTNPRALGALVLIQALLLAVPIGAGWWHLGLVRQEALTLRGQTLLHGLADPAGSDPDRFVRLAMAAPDVRYARVSSGNGRVLAQAGDARALLPTSPGHDAADGLIRLERRQTGAQPGPRAELRLEIGMSAQRDRAAQTRLAWQGMGLVLLESLLVGALLRRRQQRLAHEGVADAASAPPAPAELETLRQAEQRQRHILAHILDGILTLDAHQRIRLVSPAAGRILHREPEALGGLWLGELFAEPARALIEDLLRQDDPMALAEPMIVEALLPEGRGSVPLELRLARLDGPGRETGADRHLLVMRDMSEQLAAQEALRLRGRIIDAIGVGIVIADARLPDQPIVYTNVAFERMTGWRFAEVVGRNCRLLQGPGTDAQAVARLREAVRTGSDIEVLLLNYTREGRPFWNELRVMPIHDGAGRPTHFVALQTDVSARIASQQAIERSEARLRRVQDASHDGMVVVDAAGRIESINAGAARMFGYPEPALLGHGFDMLVPGAFAEAGLETAEREFEARHRDGTGRWIALRWSRLDDHERPDPDELHYLGVIHDISGRKRTEQELRHAKEAAEDAASAKSEFLANMSHEIRTPMHGVLGAIEMLQDTPLSGRQERYLDTARTSASILLGVIDEILDFSRLEAGKLRIESIDFDLRRTVEDVTAMLAQRAHAKKLELACFIAPEVPETVRGDPIRLRQVLVNLVGNAIKFTERGEVVVSVALEDDMRLRLEVRDTGIGIAPDKQAQLFQPFTQADSSTSRRFGGSGLGLSIARRLVELMQGRIGLDSRGEGQGARFWFTLPLQAAPHAGGGGLRGRDFSGTRILVVDDNATNRVILHRYLTAWSSQSGSASSGEEALAKLQDAAASGRPYEVALLDLNMPEMDGYTLVRAIQADPLLAPMPLIMLSSSIQDPQRLEGLRVDIWLDKPVRQSDLHDAIATVLQRRPLPAPSGRRAGRREPVQFAGERVLLVEDNEITREVGAQMLRKRGLEVGLAEDGLKAVEAILTGDWDIVLMDIQMPGMDGHDATRAVRQWELRQDRPRLPIIALTAHALPADRDKCLAAGMDDHVVKPYSADTLAAAIARWLRPSSSREGGAPVPAPAESGAELDAGRLAEVRALMGEAFDALLDKALESLADEIALLRQACAHDDTQAAGELLHRLKNTAGDIGAMRLHALAARLEKESAGSATAAQGRLPAPQDLAALEQATGRVGQALHALRERPQDTGRDP